MGDSTSEGRRSGGILGSVTEPVPDNYDHDRISLEDLLELGLAAGNSGGGDIEWPATQVMPDVSVARPVQSLDPVDESTPVNSTGEVWGETAIPPSTAHVTHCTGHDPDALAASTTTNSEVPPPVAKDRSNEPLPNTDDIFPLDVSELDDVAIHPDPGDSLDHLWYAEVPEADDEEVVGDASRDGVSLDERATQLALAFLQEEGLFSVGHLDLLADIIRQRGWTSVQYQVRGLLLAGYGIAQIHRMFQLTDAWLHCVESDTLAPERWHGGKRLTWFEAAQLLDFLGHDAELEQIADFLTSEQEVWHGLRRDSGQLATFKNYLFKYRLSLRTQVDDGIWQINLDPNDIRSFDGSRNPVFSSSWWDEPHDGGACDVRYMFGPINDPARIADWLSPDTDEMF